MMKKMLLYAAAVILIAAITAIFVVFAQPSNDKNIEFLKLYNWEVDKDYIEKEEIVLPKEFDDVYKNYNELQKEAGLDLEPYKGKKAVRYTYIVLNYPEAVDEPVRANVLCVDGIPVAGDIMTVSLRGFMHSLKYPQ
ncbi:MAG: DUF4830 domain-containing protein [Clostridia bacterium]|nr:DUF4830 domain-containing protein [Clostridia bacterium]